MNPAPIVLPMQVNLLSLRPNCRTLTRTQYPPKEVEALCKRLCFAADRKMLTFSTGMDEPRSPLDTMIASASFRMSWKFSSPCLQRRAAQMVRQKDIEQGPDVSRTVSKGTGQRPSFNAIISHVASRGGRTLCIRSVYSPHQIQKETHLLSSFAMICTSCM